MKKITKVFNSSFIKNIALLVTGTALAQLITMASSPFITRIYGPESFGMLGAFNALVMIIGPISALTYPIAIVLPKQDEKAKTLVRLSVMITVCMSLLTLLVLIFFYEKIVELFNLEEIKYFLFLLPFVIFCSGFSQVSEQWLIRKEKFKINAKTNVLQALVINLSKIVIGVFQPIGAVLIFIQSLTNGIKTYLYHFFSKKDLYFQMKNVKYKKKFPLQNVAKMFYDFPLYRAPQVLLNGVSMSIPILLLTSLFGPASAGYFTLSRTVLSAPTQLLGKSVSDVFYPKIVQIYNEGRNITIPLLQASLSLFLIGLFPFGIIILFGPTIFSFAFGEDWFVAGEYARWITIWVFFGFVNRPSVMTLPVLNAQVFHLVFTIIMLTSNVIAIISGYYYFSSDIIAVMFVGVSGGFFSILLIVMTIILSKSRKKKRV